MAKQKKQILFAAICFCCVLDGLVISELLKIIGQVENVCLLSVKLILVVMSLIFVISVLILFYISKLKFDVDTKSIQIETQEDLENQQKDVSSENISEEKLVKVITIDDISIHKTVTSIEDFANEFLIKLGRQFQICIGIMYLMDSKKFEVVGTYGYYSSEKPSSFGFGEGIAGQVAKDAKPFLMTNIPDGYIRVVSGLGNGQPRYLLILPLISGDEVYGIIELASFTEFDYDLNKVDKLISEYVKANVNQFSMSK